MSIIVILPNALRPYAAYNERVFLEASTVEDALSKLFERYPDLDRKLPDDLANPGAGFGIYRNGRDIRTLAGLDTALQDDDRLTLIVPEGDL